MNELNQLQGTALVFGSKVSMKRSETYEKSGGIGDKKEMTRKRGTRRERQVGKRRRESRERIKGGGGLYRRRERGTSGEEGLEPATFGFGDHCSTD
jgi:hypothetical protein